MAVPPRLNIIAWISLSLALVCAVVIAVDVIRRPQHMAIMNLVWPLTALYSGPIALIAYWRVGRSMSHQAMHSVQMHGQHSQKPMHPFWESVAIGATHCGSGCTLGDLIAECLAATYPPILVAAGYQSLWHQRVFAGWTIDYLFALLIGIACQYFSIVPMRHLSPGRGVIEAAKADVLSLTAWQIGMYGWMAIALFAIFGTKNLHAGEPAFWLMMQIAMLCGFVTSYPVNWWLIRSGIKERM